MAWTVEFTSAASRELDRLDRSVAVRIVDFLQRRLPMHDTPRDVGRRLTGPGLGEYWRYRVGDHRILCQLQDDRLIVLVVRVGHRSEVYR
jgi:mRNA interferase RelE/StbE